MKCENCGNHEASYHYRANINGDVSEMHLCSNCAEEQGLLRAFDYDPFENLLEDFFSPRFSLGGTMLRSLPRFRTAAVKPAVKPAEADPSLAKRREKEALRFQLEEAVKSENYEKAIELRDKLRDMDAGQE